MTRIPSWLINSLRRSFLCQICECHCDAWLCSSDKARCNKITDDIPLSSRENLKTMKAPTAFKIAVGLPDYHPVVAQSYEVTEGGWIFRFESTQLKTRRTKEWKDQTETKPHPLVACLYAHRASCIKCSFPSSSLSSAIFLGSKNLWHTCGASSLPVEPKQLHCGQPK